MFEGIMRFLKKMGKKEEKVSNSKDAAKERLHLVLMQDRANVSADFLELMKQEIIEVIKKYIDIDEKAIDVRLTNKENEDGTNGAPALYANIPILNIKNDARKIDVKENKKEQEKEEKKQTPKTEKTDEKNGKAKEKKPEETKITESKEKQEENNSEEEKKNQVENNKEKVQEHENVANTEEKKENNTKEEVKSENEKKSDLN